MALTKEEKEAAQLLKDREAAEALKQGEDLSDEEKLAIEAESARVTAQLEAEAEKKRQARLAKESAGEAKVGKTYTEDQVMALMKQLAADMKSKQGDQDDDEDDEIKKHTVRIPRFQNKFVLGFGNTNTDEYYPDLVVQAFDVWDDQQKRMVAWVEAVFEDGSTLKLPLYTLITRSTKVDCDLLEKMEDDKSFSNGKVEVMAEVQDYQQKGTGQFTKLKVVQKEYRFRVALPGGREVVVGQEIVNW